MEPWERLLAQEMSERELLDHVIECARAFGWLVHHDRPALTRSGRWVTALQGHPGFPDLVLVRPPRVLFVELKAQNGEPSEAQLHWLEQLAQCTTPEAHVWRPREWLEGTVERALARPQPKR